MNQEEVAGDWLTPAEAAKRFRVSQATIYSLLSSGRALGAIRIGQQYRLSRSALETALSVWGGDTTPVPLTRRQRLDEQKLRARRLLSGEANRR